MKGYWLDKIDESGASTMELIGPCICGYCGNELTQWIRIMTMEFWGKQVTMQLAAVAVNIF